MTCGGIGKGVSNESLHTVPRLSEAVPMRPFFRVKNGGRWRMNHTRGRNLGGKCLVCIFNLTD